MDQDAGKHKIASKLKVPRLYHKKSKSGCIRCRSRRVKCDERHPTCSSCERHAVSCSYDKLPSPPSEQGGCGSFPLTRTIKQARLVSKSDVRNLSKLLPRPAPIQMAPLPGDSTKDAYPVIESCTSTQLDILDIPESKSRRMLELRLLENFISNSCPYSSAGKATSSFNVKQTWSEEVARMGMQFDNLLYAIFATSALQLLRAEPKSAQLLAARQHYFGLSIREHREAVSQLCSENTESVLFASSLLLIDAFAALQDRPLQPYSPPNSWLNMACGVNSVFRLVSARNLMTPDTARLETFLRVSSPLSGDDAVFAEHDREGFRGLLTFNIDNSEEPWDGDTCMAYKRTLGYIGVVQMQAENGETQLENLRRVMAFPLLIPSKFIAFVEERRPRALAMLAHFFALTSKMENIWYLEGMAKREIGGIQSVLPDKWQHLVRIPVEAVGMTII